VAEPKIIIFDLETLPDMEAAMNYWPELSRFPDRTFKASVSSIICVGWKILGDNKTHCINAWDFPEWEEDVNNDKNVCEEIYSVLASADAIVTQNGVWFDERHLNTRLMKNNLPVLPPIPHIDVKKLASKNLLLINNKLGTIAKELLNDRKMAHEGWDLWVKTRKRTKSAQKTMTKYCKKDVTVTEDAFIALRPFAKNIPNYNIFYPEYASGKQVCPNCGGTRLKSNGYRRTKTMTYKRLLCLNCGSSSRTDAKGRMPRSI
jgi:hypothetical protein